MNAEITELPEYHVAYVRKMGPYGPETCGQAFNELCQWAGPRGHLAKGITFGLYLDNPEVTPAEKCRVDACVTIPPGTEVESPIAIQTIASGPHAVCHFELHATDFTQAWQDAIAWFFSNGHQSADAPCYERYHTTPEQHPDGKWVFDICLPIKRG